MKDTEKYVLVRVRDGWFLADDFVTWVSEREKAHVFVYGAALNACWEAMGGARGDVVSRFADGDCRP